MSLSRPGRETAGELTSHLRLSPRHARANRWWEVDCRVQARPYIETRIPSGAALSDEPSRQSRASRIGHIAVSTMYFAGIRLPYDQRCPVERWIRCIGRSMRRNRGSSQRVDIDDDRTMTSAPPSRTRTTHGPIDDRAAPAHSALMTDTTGT
jgi:hypothetical protein